MDEIRAASRRIPISAWDDEDQDWFGIMVRDLAEEAAELVPARTRRSILHMWMDFGAEDDVVTIFMEVQIPEDSACQ